MEFDAEAVRARVARMAEAETSLKKLVSAIAQAALLEPSKKVAYLKAATAHVKGMDPHVVKVRLLENELRSLHDGVVAGLVSKEEFVFSVAKDQLKVVANTRAALEQKLQAAEPSYEMPKLNKYEHFREKLPDLRKKDFGVVRVPVVFTNVSKGGHAYAGALNIELLRASGFRVEELDYYTVVLDQVVLGVNASNAKEALAEAVEIKALLEQKTKKPWRFVHEGPASATRAAGSFFWVMRDDDLRRFATAFNGRHVKVNKWGFAF